jgi:hypothetical protein
MYEYDQVVEEENIIKTDRDPKTQSYNALVYYQ